MNAIKINKAFKPLYKSEKRYFLITGGRGSLKSTTVHDFIARLTYERGHGILFTRYTMTSAEKSIIPEFQIALERLGCEADFHITKNVITNTRTGSFIYFSGIKTNSGDQTANLKSIAGITTWVIEEGEDFTDEKRFDSIDDSIRTKSRQNRIIWIQNPSTREHFIYQRWINPRNKQIIVEGYPVTISDNEDVEHIHVTYHIAKQYLTESWLKKAREHQEKAKQMDNPIKSWYYNNYIGGWLEKAEGVIFENWEEGEFDNTVTYCYGLDYGFSPDPLAIVQVGIDSSAKKIYCKEIAYDNNLSNDSLVQLLHNKIGYSNLIVSDTNESRTNDYLEDRGFNIEKAHKRAIIDDIRELQDYTIIVDPSSSNLKVELNNYKWNDKKASIPIDNYNHLIDGIRYAYVKLRGYNESQMVF